MNSPFYKCIEVTTTYLYGQASIEREKENGHGDRQRNALIPHSQPIHHIVVVDGVWVGGGWAPKGANVDVVEHRRHQAHHVAQQIDV